MFIGITKEIIENEIYKLDLSINFSIASLRTLFYTEVMKIVSDIGMIGGLFIIGVISAYLFFRKRFFILITLLISSFGGILFTNFLKLIIARNRPDLANRLIVESGFSFPSGHATTAFIAFPMLAIIIYFNSEIPRLFKILCISILAIFPFIVAFSRLYLGVHYFTDVLAGAVVGLSASYIFFYFKSTYKNV